MRPAHENQVRLEDSVAAALARRPATREQLSRNLAISRTTLGRALTGLMGAGFVCASTRPGSARRAGRPVEVLTLDRRRGYVAAIDVTRSGASAVLVDRLGQQLARVQGQDAQGFDATALLLSRRLHQAARAEGVNCEGVYRVGVGLPVPVPVREGGDSAAAQQRLARQIGEDWDAPVLVDNSVRMAAIAEADPDVDCLLYVSLSHGVGACVLIDSRPVRGCGALAGELGHVAVAGQDAPCYCGLRGCLEGVAGLGALCRRAGTGDPREFADAWNAGSAGAVDALRQATEALSQAVAPVVVALAPQRIVVGGELPGLVPDVVAQLGQALGVLVPPVLGWSVPVVAAHRDDDGQILGALAAVMNDRRARTAQ